MKPWERALAALLLCILWYGGFLCGRDWTRGGYEARLDALGGRLGAAEAAADSLRTVWGCDLGSVMPLADGSGVAKIYYCVGEELP